MLNARTKTRTSLTRGPATAPLGRPGDRDIGNAAIVASKGSFAYNQDDLIDAHALTKKDLNSQLYGYDQNVKASFDSIGSVVDEISSMQAGNDYETRVRQHIKDQLGFDIPTALLADAGMTRLDTSSLYAWCLFETYKHYCNTFLVEFPYCEDDGTFQSFLQDCGFHALDISPCADGRLAHVISYVLRLPYKSVRRKSYAGAMFDVEDSLDKWVETEMIRFREGAVSNGLPTSYLKTVVYHFSSRDPDHEGCAAHGSNAEVAAESGLERLMSLKQAIENTYCCGASVECLLIGLDTDTDIIRIHMPDQSGDIQLDQYIDANEIYASTKSMDAATAKTWIQSYISGECPSMQQGMVKFLAYLLTNNISQIDYVKTYHGGYYEDIGHAEYFIGAGIGFEEVQLRNLTYFAYLNTVEEATNDLDVGIKIFTKLNISRGLPVPVVVRYDYHGNVPGARDRAVQHCQRVSDALDNRYQDLQSQGLLHTLMVAKDVNNSNTIEILGSSVSMQATQEAH